MCNGFSQESPDEVCATCPPECTDNWAKIDAQVKAITDMKDPLKRNEVITEAYKSIAKKNPENRWAKLASYVSAQAGCGMEKTRGFDAWGADLLRMVDKKNVMSALADGNKTIFGSVAPPFMYVKKHGYDSFFACLKAKQPPMNKELLTAMRIMQEGDKNKLRMAANIIANYEQKNVVAKVYERHADTFKDIDSADTSRLDWGDTSRNQQSIPINYKCTNKGKVLLQGPLSKAEERVKYYRALMKQLEKQMPSW